MKKTLSWLRGVLGADLLLGELLVRFTVGMVGWIISEARQPRRKRLTKSSKH